MGISSIDVTQAAEAIPVVVAARALESLKSNTVLARLVARNWDSDVAEYGDTVNIPIPGALTAQDKTAGNAVTLQNTALTKAQVVLNQHKHVSFLIEDVAAALSRPELLSIYMDEGIKRIAEQIDSDLAALYSGFSQSIDATTGLGEATFREARRLLNAAKAPLSDRFAVLNEDAEAEFLGIDKAVKEEYRGSLGGAVADAYAGRFMGFNVHMDQQVAVVTGEVKNLFGHKNAAVLATRPLPQVPNGMGVMQTVMSEDGIGLRVTLGYSQNYLGLQCTIDVLYGVAELRDDHGVVVRTSAA